MSKSVQLQFTMQHIKISLINIYELLLSLKELFDRTFFCNITCCYIINIWMKYYVWIVHVLTRTYIHSKILKLWIFIRFCNKRGISRFNNVLLKHENKINNVSFLKMQSYRNSYSWWFQKKINCRAHYVQ